jgi:hypothetical protein
MSVYVTVRMGEQALCVLRVIQAIMLPGAKEMFLQSVAEHPIQLT